MKYVNIYSKIKTLKMNELWISIIIGERHDVDKNH